jgi:FG-GAP-like repeat
VKMKLISRGPACLMFTLFVAMTGAALAGNPVPLVNQPLVPDAVAPGGAAFVLTLNGSGFVSGSVVRWNGSALATTFVSGSQLKASVPASDVPQPGTASVTVVNPGPGGGTSNVVYFAVGHPTSSVSLRTNSYTAGSGFLDSLAIGDFNDDGKADLAMTDANGLNASVLLSNGDGTFQPPVTYATGIPNAVVTADFNGDGKLDLAVAYSNGASVSGGVAILLGNGDGTFRAAVNYGSGPSGGRSTCSKADVRCYTHSLAVFDISMNVDWMHLVVSLSSPGRGAALRRERPPALKPDKSLCASAHRQRTIYG